MSCLNSEDYPYTWFRYNVWRRRWSRPPNTYKTLVFIEEFSLISDFVVTTYCYALNLVEPHGAFITKLSISQRLYRRQYWSPMGKMACKIRTLQFRNGNEPSYTIMLLSYYALQTSEICHSSREAKRIFPFSYEVYNSGQTTPKEGELDSYHLRGE